jgi:predicted enzyme related to lactoylglutathione lyase
MSADSAAGFEFYSALFGWAKLDTMDMGEAGIYQMFGQGDSPPLGGMYTKSPDMPGPSAWLNYFVVEDVHKTCELLPSLGATILNGPMEVPGGDYVAQCMDPQGAAFAIHSQSSKA